MIIAKLKLPSHTYLWREIHNTGHTFLFGAFSLAVLAMVRQYLPASASRPLFQYALALVITTFSGALVELAQIYLPGDSDLYDLSRDIAGAVAALGFRAAVDKSIRKTSDFAKSSWQKFFLVISFVALVAALTPLALLTTAYVHRNISFPIIADFQTPWLNPLIKTKKVSWSLEPSPSVWNGHEGRVGKLQFLPAKYPTFSIEEPYPNWENYNTLQFQIFSPNNEIVTIGLSIEDSHHDKSFEDRFNLTIDLKKGQNDIAISLEKIQLAPKKRQMDMKAINSIHIFTGVIEKPVLLYLDNIRLK